MDRSSRIGIVVVLSTAVGSACSHADATRATERPPGARLPSAVVVERSCVPVAEAEPASLPDASQAETDAVVAAAPSGAQSCPDAMVLVDGDRCTEVGQKCVEWLDARTTPLARCARFAPSVCKGARVHERFCIDRDEYVAPGQTLPAGDASWTEARATCEHGGKRLCRESEWELACEGQEALPYTTGYVRDAVACNFDKGHLVDPETGKLRDLREPPSSLDRCVSPFGVRGMTGNVDEWVWRDHSAGAWRSALKGGWWMAARERCRPATTSHDENYREIQTGFRCCADSGG